MGRGLGCATEEVYTQIVAQRFGRVFLLVLEGWLHETVAELHLKNYAYFAMAFSLIVEMINLRMREKSQPVHLHSRTARREGGQERKE